MKKIYTWISVMALLLAGCTQELEEPTAAVGTEVSTINFDAEDFSGETRTSISANGYTVSWSAGDKVGIFPMTTNDNQVAFDISKGAESSHASFDGKGWGVKNGVQYAAYYPLQSDALLDKNKVELNYLGQVQNGNGSTAHLGAYDFMMASPTAAVDGVADFKFNHLGALLKIELQVPVAATWSSLTLHSDNAKFIEKSTVDLSTGALTVTESSSSITLGLKGVTTTSSQKTITAYMMMGVRSEGYVNLSGSTITAWIKDDSGKEYVIEVNDPVVYKNRFYTLSSKESSTPVMKDASQNVAKLVDGSTFNTRIKSLVNETSVNYNYEDNKVQSIIFMAISGVDFDVMGYDKVEVSASNSPVKAYAYNWGGDGNVIWIHTQGYRFEANKNSAEMFSSFRALTSLDLKQLDTHNVTNLFNMFAWCSSLTDLDLSHFDTSNVVSMQAMFWHCDGLTSLDISSFDTSNVTDMSHMFLGCGSLSGIDVCDFDTKNVTNMKSMFHSCKSLTGLNLSHFDTRRVTHMEAMFAACEKLKDLDISGFDTSKVTDMSDMFNSCNALTNLDLSHFDTKNVLNMQYMFRACSSLANLDLSSFDTSKVTNMQYMFGECTNMTTLNLTNFSIGSSVTKTDMFKSFASEYSRMLSIYCSQAVYNVLKSSSSETKLDTSKVLWPFIQ